MATESTPEENDPEADNRDEYVPPPCALPLDESRSFDEDGYPADEEVYEEAADVDPMAAE